MIKFFKNLFKSKLKCSQCGSTNIVIEEKAKRTGGGYKDGKLMSYGYFYDEHTCECGNTWEVRK